MPLSKVKSAKQRARIKARVDGYEVSVRNLPPNVPKESLTKPGSSKK